MTIQSIEGWLINSCNPTDKVMKGTKQGTTVYKYKFLQGLDFQGQIEIFDTSEKGAWRQLKHILNSMNCVQYQQYKTSTCGEVYSCCDCGGNDCGCGYCFSCNACEYCLDEE